MIGNVWIAAMEGDSLADKTYNYVAFKGSAAEFEQYVERVQSLGVEILEGRDRVAEEWRSCYFYD